MFLTHLSRTSRRGLRLPGKREGRRRSRRRRQRSVMYPFYFCVLHSNLVPLVHNILCLKKFHCFCTAHFCIRVTFPPVRNVTYSLWQADRGAPSAPEESARPSKPRVQKKQGTTNGGAIEREGDTAQPIVDRKQSNANRQGGGARASGPKPLEPDNYDPFCCAACMLLRGSSLMGRVGDEQRLVFEAVDAMDVVQCNICHVRVHRYCYGVSEESVAGKDYICRRACCCSS